MAPRTLDEAVGALEKHDDAHVLAGGHSLLPMLRLRLLKPSYLVDIGRISELRRVRVEDGQVRIGAMVTYADLQKSTDIGENLPLLSDGAATVGDPQVRNRGTIGGSLAHCDPAGDIGSCVLSLRGSMVVHGKSGRRTVDSDNWFVSPFQSALGPAEILEEIVISQLRGTSGGAYVKFGRNAGDFATSGAAVQLSFERSDVCTYAGVGLTGVGATNLRAKSAEAALLGKRIDAGVIEKAATAASEECSPPSDSLRGSEEYKRALTKAIVTRAIDKALERAGKADRN